MRPALFVAENAMSAEPTKKPIDWDKITRPNEPEKPVLPSLSGSRLIDESSDERLWTFRESDIVQSGLGKLVGIGVAADTISEPPEPLNVNNDSEYPKVIEDVERMRQFHSDYTVPTAKQILDVISTAHRLCALNGGEWGRQPITDALKKQRIMTADTVGRYLAAFRGGGLTEYKGIPIPGRRKRHRQ